jgi:mRNA deadenylase 3'-5' endonuclease subunit Ccr4
MNRILLCEKNLDKNDELIDVIFVSEIKIVNRERFDKLINELKNYRNYILRGEDVEYKKYQEMSEKELSSNGYYSRYVHDYVEIYRNISTYWGMEEDTLAIFKNIRAKLVELMEKLILHLMILNILICVF